MSGISSWLGFDKITAALRKRIARFAVQKSLGKVCGQGIMFRIPTYLRLTFNHLSIFNGTLSKRK